MNVGARYKQSMQNMKKKLFLTNKISSSCFIIMKWILTSAQYNYKEKSSLILHV